MPPAAPPMQGSRTGLIAALVVSLIVAVAMIVVAIYGFQKWNEADRALAELRDQHKPFIADPDLSDPRVQALNTLKDQPPFTGLPSAMQVSLAESDQLSKLVGGNTTPDKAADVARTALADAGRRIDELNTKKLVSFTLPKDTTLIAAVSALTDQLTGLAAAKQDVQNQLAASEKSKQETIAAQKAQLEAKDKLIQEANAKAEASATEAKQYQQQAADAQAALQASANNDMKKLQDTNAALTTQLQAKDKQILSDTKLIAGYKTKLHQVRANPTEAIIQHPDGNIIRATDYKTVFINLGQRQHVTKGLTFEVYDKNKGIPPLGNGLDETNGLPTGKASIEVFNVGPDTSECRIIKVQPGQTIIIGDLIANLVYDPSVSYNFFVFGKFDLSNSGVPTPGDAEIIKRLITQWGGKTQQTVDLDTDFVVMGAEPVVHPISDPNNAGEVLRHNQEQADLKKYQDTIAAASQLGVPVMNQNRFLYFVGYYDQATR